MIVLVKILKLLYKFNKENTNLYSDELKYFMFNVLLAI